MGSGLKAIIPVLCLVFLFLSGCDSQTQSIQIVTSTDLVKGSGQLESEVRSVGGYTGIEVSSVIQLKWKADKTPSLKVTGEENLLPHLKTEVVDRTLKVYFDENVLVTKEVVVTTSSPRLGSYTGSGSSDGSLSGVTGEQFQVSLSGTSSCKPIGQTESLKVSCSGASSFEGSQLKSKTASVTLSGTAKGILQTKNLPLAEAQGASALTVSGLDGEKLTVDLSGTSKGVLSGTAKNLLLSASGASNLKASALKVQSTQVDCSGTAQALIDVVKRITGSLSGASRLEYLGNPTRVSIERSGVAFYQKK